MRKWIPRLLIIAFLWIVIARLAEIKKLGGILAGGRWQWIGAALLLQFIYYALYTGLYKSAFAAVGVKSRWRDLLPVTLGSLFVNVVAPAGGMTGAALFVDDAVRRGESGAKAAAGTLLVTITELGAFEALLLPGMVYLYTHHDLKAYEVVGAAALTALVTVLSFALILGLWRPACRGGGEQRRSGLGTGPALHLQAREPVLQLHGAARVQRGVRPRRGLRDT